jgi:hypothetical protein
VKEEKSKENLTWRKPSAIAIGESYESCRGRQICASISARIIMTYHGWLHQRKRGGKSRNKPEMKMS